MGIGGTPATNTKLLVKAGTNLNFEVENASSNLRLSALNDARDANIALQFASSSFEFLTGVVNVGTTSGTQPSYFNSFLNVQNNGSTGSHASVTITSGSGGFAGLHFGDSDNGRIGQVTYNNSDNSLLFTANNSERFRIASAGQLGIGGATYGTSGQVLTSGGSGAAPSWADAGGGGSFEFTASSALSSGQVAALQSNGQVKPVTATIGTLATVANPYTNADPTQNQDIAYQANVSNMVQVWTDPSNGYFKVSNYTRATDGTLTRQGETNIRTQASDYARIAYNPDRGACLVVFTTGSSYDDLKVASIYVNSSNGRSIHQTVELSNIGNWTGTDVCYDESLDKFVVIGQRGNDTHVYLIDQQADYSISSVATLQLNLQTAMRNSHVATNNNGQFAYFGADTTNSRVSVMTFSVSGNTITAGSVTSVAASNIGTTYGRSSIIYDSTNSAWLAAYYYRSGTNDWIYMRTITISSNTATVGSSQPLINFPDNTSKGSVTIAADSVGGIVAFYGNDTNKIASKQVTIANTGSGATGLTISTGSEIVLSDHSNSFPSDNYGFEVASSGGTHNTFVQYTLTYAKSGAATYAEGAEKSVTSDSASFIGLAEGAIAQGASGKITHLGGVNENQSGLTANTTYYVGLSGALQTTDSGVLAGVALSSSKILVKG